MPPKRSTRATTKKAAAQAPPPSPGLSHEQRRQKLAGASFPITPYLDEEDQALATKWGVILGSNEWVELMTWHVTVETVKKHHPLPQAQGKALDMQGNANHGDANTTIGGDGVSNELGERSTHQLTADQEPRASIESAQTYGATAGEVVAPVQEMKSTRTSRSQQSHEYITSIEAGDVTKKAATGQLKPTSASPTPALETDKGADIDSDSAPSPLTPPPPPKRGRPPKIAKALAPAAGTKRKVDTANGLENAPKPKKIAISKIATLKIRTAKPPPGINSSKRKADASEADDASDPRQPKRSKMAAPETSAQSQPRATPKATNAAPKTMKNVPAPTQPATMHYYNTRRSKSLAATSEQTTAQPTATPEPALSTTQTAAQSTTPEASSEDPRPFKCPYDGCKHHTTGFKRQEHLRRHVNSLHEHSEIFKCEECGAKFTRKDNSKQHRQSCTGVKSEEEGEEGD